MAEAEGALSARQAARVIQRATTYEEPLRRRMEGATWMVWGTVTAGSNLSYGLAYALGWSDSGLWAPWLALGILLSLAVRRIAVLSKPDVAIGWRAGVLAMVGLAVFMTLAYTLSTSAGHGPETSTFVGFSFMGILWMVFAAWNPHRATLRGRQVMVAIGAAIVALGAAYAWFVPVMPPSMWPQAAFVAASIGGVPPVLGGLWQVLRS
jgi:hypothetical protein